MSVSVTVEILDASLISNGTVYGPPPTRNVGPGGDMSTCAEPIPVDVVGTAAASGGPAGGCAGGGTGAGAMGGDGGCGCVSTAAGGCAGGCSTGGVAGGSRTVPGTGDDPGGAATVVPPGPRTGVPGTPAGGAPGTGAGAGGGAASGCCGAINGCGPPIPRFC